ncbi:MAG TPA: 3-isopropylmalate dehydratase [Caulobacteraceae bacterium]|nr:3-isopropylmalate dehydratase [Caulobacteraceae bacterium]
MARAFVFGDNIDTDLLAPGHAMKLEPHAMARFCLEAVDPSFASTVKPGDIVVAGRNFGMGSSREQAAISLKLLGVSAVFAQSFARIFFRNAINAGLPALVLPDADAIRAGDDIAFDLGAGVLDDLTQQRRHAFQALPPHLLALIQDGGLVPNLMRRFAKAAP